MASTGTPSISMHDCEPRRRVGTNRWSTACFTVVSVMTPAPSGRGCRWRDCAMSPPGDSGLCTTSPHGPLGALSVARPDATPRRAARRTGRGPHLLVLALTGRQPGAGLEHTDDPPHRRLDPTAGGHGPDRAGCRHSRAYPWIDVSQVLTDPPAAAASRRRAPADRAVAGRKLPQRRAGLATAMCASPACTNGPSVTAELELVHLAFPAHQPPSLTPHPSTRGEPCSGAGWGSLLPCLRPGPIDPAPRRRSPRWRYAASNRSSDHGSPAGGGVTASS